jgi:hypothetical protein
MNESNQNTHGNEGPEHPRVGVSPDRNQGPYWKRVHHHWYFWVALFLMFAAITIYILSEDLSLLPFPFHINRHPAQQEPPR